MVDKKEEKIERVYVVNLSKAYKTVRQKRARKSIMLLKEFIARHLKEDQGKIRVSNKLNQKIFENSIKQPPKKLKIRVIKDKTMTKAYLFDEEIEQKPKNKKEETKEKKENQETDKKQEEKVQEVDNKKN
ncbi:MAG: 60S ribosomal protein L31 [Candidatus Omnitrophica bacterium]|nr:60S ribosomal protein L31 [Candidatus Omnitrophota bacterium]